MPLLENFENQTLLDKLFRGIRATMGAFILAVIMTSILIPQILAVSGKSIVNAKLEWIRTPINGNVSYNNLKQGNTVSKGTLLGEINNARADDSFLNSLQFEKSALESSLFSLNSKQQQLTNKMQNLQNTVAEALGQLKEKTDIQINTLTAEINLAQDKIIEIENQIKRYENANDSFSDTEPYSVVSREILDEQRQLLAEVKTYAGNQRDTLKLVKTNYDSAINGVFTNQNTPQEQQQLNSIEQDLTTIISDKKALQLKLEKISTDIEERAKHLNLNKQHQFISRVDGILWDIGYADGSYVNNGDSLVAIADINSLTVESIFHQRYLDNIMVGDFATIQLMGSDQKTTGRVSKVMIRESDKNTNLNAFSSTIPSTNEFKVMVTLDQNNSHIPKIGQRAKVVITKNKTSITSKLLLFLSR